MVLSSPGQWTSYLLSALEKRFVPRPLFWTPFLAMLLDCCAWAGWWSWDYISFTVDSSLRCIYFDGAQRCSLPPLTSSAKESTLKEAVCPASSAAAGRSQDRSSHVWASCLAPLSCLQAYVDCFCIKSSHGLHQKTLDICKTAEGFVLSHSIYRCTMMETTNWQRVREGWQMPMSWEGV